MMPDELKTLEKYVLAQLLVCGKINYHEFERSNDFLEDVSRTTINALDNKGYLDYLLFDNRRVN